MPRPPHHLPDGRFVNPWPVAAGDDELRGRVLEFMVQWWTRDRDVEPGEEDLPAAEPRMARPRVREGETRLTWVGHSTYLVQLPGLNLLTDPVWSMRTSPIPWGGPRRFVPPVPELEALPPVDGVLLSHDHYDHLDKPTVRRLAERYEDLTWFTPLGYADWFGNLGIDRLVELDWWEEADFHGYRIACAPARHWTRRTPRGTNTRLWSSWAVREPGDDGPSVYFAGDSGYGPFFREVGERFGPFDVTIVPIGAYEPRWFMAPAHINPEEAVQVYRDLGGSGRFVPAHWGAFRLTLEPPLEPPERLRAAWADAGLPDEDLSVLDRGETMVLGGADPTGE